MFVYNFKVNGNKVFKGIIIIAALIVFILFCISTYKIFTNGMNSSNETETVKVNDEIHKPDISIIKSSEYTNILKEVHDNPKTYVGQKISFTGYVYRIDNFDDDEFVLARNMIVNEASQTVVVGFLSQYEKASELEDFSWVNVTGTIEIGNYYGEIPVLKITSVEKVSKPEDEFVYPPDDTYVPTAVIY